MHSLSTRLVAILIISLQAVFATYETITRARQNDSPSMQFDFHNGFNQSVDYSSVNTTNNEENRVYHGSRVTDINQVPYIVSLLILKKADDKYEWEWTRCGAILIAPKYLLTAAHCVVLYDEETGESTLTNLVYAGVHSLQSKLNVPSRNVFPVARMYVPERYDLFENAGCDVAVLELNEEVPEEYRHFATLAHPDEDAGDMVHAGATLYGWGETSEYKTNSEDLLKGNVVIMSYEDCKSNTDLPVRGETDDGVDDIYISKSHICYAETYQINCHGDSGGPIIVKDKVVGIISLGSEVCDPKSPALGIRVTAVWDFINEYAHLGLERNKDSSRWSDDPDTAPDSAGPGYETELVVLGSEFGLSYGVDVDMPHSSQSRNS